MTTERAGRRATQLKSLSVVCVVLSFVATALAQEGHPLVGTWYGDWGPSPKERHDVTIVMSWDGKTIGGTVDPGPDAVPFKAATVSYTHLTLPTIYSV